MRTLLLLRHAKSDYPAGVPDHDRPLNERGRRDAPVAGRWLTAHAPALDLVLVSSARRAQQTWQLASADLDVPGVVRTEPRVYEASVSILLNVVRSIPETVQSALLVGHNPGLEELAELMANDGEPSASRAISVKYPTSEIGRAHV